MTDFGLSQGLSALAAQFAAKRGLDAFFGGFLTALGVNLALSR